MDEELFWKKFTLKVKTLFLNFLIFLINNFENFYKLSPQTLKQSQDSRS